MSTFLAELGAFSLFTIPLAIAAWDWHQETR